jgi:DNA-binding MarR family transcriptional regulator
VEKKQMEEQIYQLRYLVMPEILYKADLNATELKVLCFILSYKSNSFYFSNEHLAKMFGVDETTISRAVSKLAKDGYIKIKYQIKSGGGKVRYIEALIVKNNDFDLAEEPIPTTQECYVGLSENDKSDLAKMLRLNKDNKIKDNKLKNIVHAKTENDNSLNYFVELWNEFAERHGLAKVIKLSDKRRRAIRARIQEKEFDFEKILERIEQSDFLLGAKGWRVDFDFIFCSANNYLKILEGKYNGKNSTTIDELKHTAEQAKRYYEARERGIF